MTDQKIVNVAAYNPSGTKYYTCSFNSPLDKDGRMPEYIIEEPSDVS